MTCTPAAVCSEFELKEARRPVLADMERLQQRASKLAQEARAQVAADNKGQFLPKDTIPDDVLPAEVYDHPLSAELNEQGPDLDAF